MNILIHIINNYHNISKFLDYLSKSTLKYSFVLKYNKRNNDS